MSKNLDIVVQSDKCHGLSYTVPIKHRIIQVHYKRDIRSKQNKRNCRENKQRKDRQLLCLLVVLQIHPLLKSFFLNVITTNGGTGCLIIHVTPILVSHSTGCRNCGSCFAAEQSAGIRHV